MVGIAIARRGRRVRRLLGVVVAAVLVADLALLYLHAPAHTVSVDTAIRRYRATASPAQPSDTARDEAATVAVMTAAPARSSRGLTQARPAAAPSTATFAAPKSGVYTYNTTGYEETDALGGARHEYPSQTAITVRPQDCGWVQHWQPLEERWDDVDLCTTNGTWTLLGVKTFHEFFRQTQEQDSTCDSGAVYVPPPATAGATSTFTCRGSFGAMDFTAQVVGPEDIVVGGRPTSGLRVHYVAKFTGSNRGTGDYDEWTAPNGALLQRTWDMHIVTDSPFGTVHYDERYTITLTAMEPQT